MRSLAFGRSMRRPGSLLRPSTATALSSAAWWSSWSPGSWSSRWSSSSSSSSPAADPDEPLDQDPPDLEAESDPDNVEGGGGPTPQRVRINREREEQVTQELMQRNQVWRDGALQWNPDAFREENQTHNPRFLIVGCSDARVPLERVFGMKAGEAFVHRNVGNLVVGTDLNFLSVLQYAVDVLQVEHILVCGHYECGACRGAVMPQDLGLVENWLRNIRDVHRLNHKELALLGDPSSDEFHRRLVELNVREQCINLFKTSTVQQSRTKNGFPSIHGFVYDINTGRVLPQDAQLYDYIRRYKRIYRLYS